MSLKLPPLPPLVEPAELEPLLSDPAVLVVDLCQPHTWERLHIPGAVHVKPFELVLGIPPAAGKLPSVARLNALFSRIGYHPDLHIVAYDDEGGGWAGRFLWTLDVIGHRQHSLLNGGLHSWLKEGHPIASDVPSITPTSVSVTIQDEPIAEIDTILATLADPTVKIWDARSSEEYLGLRAGSMRNGHIPGAVNLDWVDVMDPARNLRLLPLAVIRDKLRSLGINDDDSIITHCQSHHRSGLTYMVAKLLGHRAKGYHGSWGEWGNNPDVPIESVA